MQTQKQTPSGGGNLSLSQHNSKVEMELQLKQQKLLGAKKKAEGHNSTLNSKKKLEDKSSTVGRSPTSGGSNLMTNILFLGIDQPQSK